MEKLDKLVKAAQQARLGKLRSEPRRSSTQVQNSKHLLYHLLILRISVYPLLVTNKSSNATPSYPVTEYVNKVNRREPTRHNIQVFKMSTVNLMPCWQQSNIHFMLSASEIENNL